MLQDFISPARSLFAAGAHTELRAQLNRQRSVVLQNGDVVGNARQDVSGVSARVYKGGVYGFASMAELTGEAAASVVKAATENAQFMDGHIALGKPALPSIASGAYNVGEVELPDPAQKAYLDAARELDAYIAKKYPGLMGRRVVAMADSAEKVMVCSDGWTKHSVMPRAFMLAALIAQTPSGTPVNLSVPFGGYGVFDERFADLTAMYAKVDEVYEQLMHKREGVYAEAGYKTVILGSMMSGMLAHEAVGHTVEADLVIGGSVAGPNLGKQVASELVSLVDFANTAFGEPAPLPLFVDDEGTPCTDATLIDRGTLVGYMNNRQSAEQFGMTPNGNARAYLFSDEPLIRMRNTTVLPGSSSLEDMIASVDDGYYLIESNNGQADTTGEFMFGVTMGYEIKHGKLGRAILDTTISGVAFDMLKTVDMVSSKVGWTCMGMCGKKQPMPVGMGGPELRCKVMIGGR